MNEIFKLRNFENKWGEGPDDRFILIREVTFDSNGEAKIPMHGLLKPGAQIDVILLDRTSVTLNGLTSAKAGNTSVVAGDVVVSASAYSGTNDGPAYVVGGTASTTGTVMILIKGTDFAESGD